RRGGLLLQGAADLAVLVLERVEQPHVLDRNDGLVGESLQQRDVRLSEWTMLVSRHRNHPDDAPIEQHRHTESTPRTKGHRYRMTKLSVCEHVREMDNCAF